MKQQTKTTEIGTKDSKWLSFQIENYYHDLLVKISASDERSMAKEIRSLIKSRAKELGIITEKKK